MKKTKIDGKFSLPFRYTDDISRINLIEEIYPISNLLIESISNINQKKLIDLCQKLMLDYQKNKQQKEKVSKQTGHIFYEEYYPRLSKPIIDEIDKILAEHYGFTEAELDFIINYDIKYRMGKELEEDDN